MRRTAVLLAVLFGFACLPSLQAMTIVGATATVNDRFASGFPTTPVANTSASFLAHGLNLSGVGWRDSDTRIGITMISPRQFVTAYHAAPGTSSTVSFFGSDNQLHQYTVQSTTRLTYGGNGSDLVIGTLSTSIDTAHVAYYPILYVGTPLTSINLSAYTAATLLVYGQNGQVGINRIEAFGGGDLYGSDGNLGTDGVSDSYWFGTRFDATTGETQGGDGDSGSPTFVPINGVMTLVGVHSAVGTIGSDQYTFDNFLALPEFISQMSTVAGNTGNSVSLVVIPEPAAVAACLAAGALLVAGGRRRKAA